MLLGQSLMTQNPRACSLSLWNCEIIWPPWGSMAQLIMDKKKVQRHGSIYKFSI